MNVPYRVISNLVDAFAELKEDEPLCADTETCGFYQKVRLIQLYQPHLDAVLLVEWPEEILLATMLDKYTTLWHNAHYDITTIQQQTHTRWVPKAFEDTFLLARLHFYMKEKFSLDETFEYVLGYCPYTRQGLDKKVLQKGKWDVPVLSKDQLLYAATDVYYMPQLWDIVKDKRHTYSYKLDMLTLRYCFDFQWNGMPVNKQRLYERYEANQEEIEELAVPVNCNSWQQVRPYIGENESDGLALATFGLQGNQRAKDVQRTRKLIKQNSFLDKFDTIGGRIFGKFLPSARSGRLTSKDQNLQQLPRELKDCFEAAEGRALWYADYAQVELRTICAITVCRAMEKLFREGIDLHGFTAEMIFGKDWTKKHRQLSKTYNFNFLYGGGIKVLIGILIMQAGILLDERQGNRDRRMWRNLWREVYAWQERGIANWKAGRPGSTPMGRRYKAKMMTDQLNIENQGAGAEVAKLALHYLHPRIAEYNEAHGTDFMIINFIHDSFIIEGPNDEVHYEPVSSIIASSMQEAWFETSKAFAIKDLPMPVNVKVGTNWGAIEDDDAADLYNYELEGMALCNNSN